MSRGLSLLGGFVLAITGCHHAFDPGTGGGDTDVDTDADTDTDTDVDGDSDADTDSDGDSDTDTDVDTSTEPIPDLDVSCAIEMLEVEGEIDPPANNLYAVISCTFENSGLETVYLSSTFPGELKSHPAAELLDSELYPSNTYWDGSVLPDEIETNTYARVSDGAYVSGMSGSELFVITVTVVDENGHTVVVTTEPAEASWGA